jgi:hypothetical protein
VQEPFCFYYVENGEEYFAPKGAYVPDNAQPLYTTPTAAQQEPNWKTEYLKSVESGCITLDELREANAELDATNRQVEILSDALAESRREVAAQPAPVKVWEAEGYDALMQEMQMVKARNIRQHAEIERLKAAQPAAPDAMTSADIQEHIEYVAGWNDCRAEMLKGMK